MCQHTTSIILLTLLLFCTHHAQGHLICSALYDIYMIVYKYVREQSGLDAPVHHERGLL